MNNSPRDWQQTQRFGRQPVFWWYQPLVIGIIGLGVCWIYASTLWWPSPAEQPQLRELPVLPPVSLTLAVPRPLSAPEQVTVRSKPHQQPLRPASQNVQSVQDQVKASPAAFDAIQATWRLNDIVKQFKGQQTISPEKVTEIKHVLRDLRKQGVAAIPALLKFLKQQGDVDFAKIKGGELFARPTFRQTVMDTLQKIGGDDAVRATLSVLSTVQDPAEIALLARGLEKEVPGVYRQEALQAANRALQLWAGTKEQVEARPLFELLRDMGGPEAVAILAQFPARADARQTQYDVAQTVPLAWKVYSLIALTGLPDGEGVPSLISLARDPRIPVEKRSSLPFQMLAQSAMDYDEAGQALIELARAGQIPGQAWKGLGEVLAGNYWQFPSQLSGGVTYDGKGTDNTGVEAPLMRTYTDVDGQLIVKYEQRTVAVDWSQKQIKREVALIDNLLNATSNPIAKQSLQHARATLQEGQ